MPLVSIIVPVYNAEKSVNKTLDALAGQTLQDIEIICVDDASTDGTLSVLRDYETKYKNLRVIAGPAQGTFLTRELGLQNAAGEFIGFCDADDIPEFNMYERLYRHAIETNADITVCAYRRVNADKGNTSVEMTSFGDASYDTINDKGWLVSVNTALWNKLIRRKTLEGRYIPENPPAIAEDAFLLLSAYEHTNRIAFIDEPLYNYYVTAGSAMKTVTTEQTNELFKAWKQLRLNTLASNPSYLDIIDLAAFIHLGLSLGSRLALQKDGSLGELFRKLDVEFPLQAKSKYLTRAYVKEHPSLKTTKLAHMLKDARLVVPALKTYATLDNMLGSSIKW